MTRTLSIAVIAGLGSLASVAAEPEPHGTSVAAIFAACDEFGLVSAADMVTTPRTAAELAKTRAEIGDRQWIMMIPGLELALTEPSVVHQATHDTGFRIAVYVAQNRITLVSVIAPVENGKAEMQIESMIAAATAVVPADEGAKEWLRDSAIQVWEKYYDDTATTDDILKFRTSGDFTLSIWGVPPDVFFVNVVRARDG